MRNLRKTSAYLALAAAVVLPSSLLTSASAQARPASCSFGVTTAWLTLNGTKYAIGRFTNNLNCTGVDAVQAEDPTSDGKWVVAKLVVITSGAPSGPSTSTEGHNAPYTGPWVSKSLPHGIKYEFEVASYNSSGLQDATYVNVNS